MKNETLYNKTVDILVEAYFNDELISQDCCACACGNLIAKNNNYKRVEIANKVMWVTKDGEYINPLWSNVFATGVTTFFGFTVNKKQWLHLQNYNAEAKEEILSTGYQLHELTQIESAFEKGYKGADPMFNAMIAVIDVLDNIHDNKDSIRTTYTKQRFVKA